METWCAAVHGVTKSQTWLRNWTTRTVSQETCGFGSRFLPENYGIEIWMLITSATALVNELGGVWCFFAPVSHGGECFFQAPWYWFLFIVFRQEDGRVPSVCITRQASSFLVFRAQISVNTNIHDKVMGRSGSHIQSSFTDCVSSNTHNNIKFGCNFVPISF